MQQGAPEPGRTEQAAQILPHRVPGLCPEIHPPPHTGSRDRLAVAWRGSVPDSARITGNAGFPVTWSNAAMVEGALSRDHRQHGDFVVSEALVSVAKYADATAAVVRASWHQTS